MTDRAMKKLDDVAGDGGVALAKSIQTATTGELGRLMAENIQLRAVISELNKVISIKQIELNALKPKDEEIN